MSTTGLILAAGSSSRMSKYKQLLTFRGKTLMNDIINKAATLGLDEIICITGHLQTDIIKESDHNQVKFLHNDNHIKGLTSSLKLGIYHINEKSNAEYTLVMLTDQPLIPIEHYEQLLSQTQHHSLIATSYANTIGVPAIYARKHYDDIIRLDDNASPKALLKKHKNIVSLVPCEDAKFDIDTDDDYQKLLSQYE